MERENNKVDNFLDDKILEIHRKKLAEKKEMQAKKTENKQKNKSKRKGLIISIISLVMAGLIAIGCTIGFKKKTKNTDIPKNSSIVTTVDDLGMEEEITSNVNTQYGETTGNIKKEELVEKNGVVYKDKEAASKADKVGTSSIDLQGGKLKVDKDGDVVTKEEKGYEVKDETGKTIDKGTNDTGIPKGYAFDPVLNKIVKEDEVGKFVYADNNYYSKIDGMQICKKGDIVLKSSLERWKKDQNVTTTKPQITTSNKTSSTTTSKPSSSSSTTTSKPSSSSSTTTSKPSSSSNTTTSKPSSSSNTTTSTQEKVDEGVINKDGTFTIGGVTFIDKATWQTIVLGEYNEEDLRYNDKGVIYIKENTSSKVR